MTLDLKKLAELSSAELDGDPSIQIDGVATLQAAKPGQLSFLSNPAYRKYLESTKASVVVLSPDDAKHCSCAKLISNNPYVAYAKIAREFVHSALDDTGVHPSAAIEDDVSLAEGVSVGPNVSIGSGSSLGKNVHLGPGCVVGENVVIGDNTVLVANVTILDRCQVGERCLFHPGVVIGADGFGIANDDGKWIKVPQLGAVQIGNDVEVGANSTIDRGALEDTEIHDGVKLDNQIQIAHNVVIGEHTAIAGCVGISGSTRIGKYCAIGGGVGISGHLEIADGVQITGMSLITKSIKDAGVYSGSVPSMEAGAWHKNFARVRQLDDLFRRVKTLENQINRNKD